MAPHGTSEYRSCGVSGCRETPSRIYSRCDRHSCFVGGCRKQPQFQRKNLHCCAYHTPCLKKECASYAPANLKDSDMKNFSLYCEAHRCAETFCIHEARHEIIEQENGKDYVSRLCDQHYDRMKCLEQDCKYSRDVREPTSWPFCTKHSVCAMCNGKRQSNSQFCFNHKCRRDGCEAAQEEGLYFCTQHKCHADSFGRNPCDGVPYILAGVWQDLCAKHICGMSLSKRQKKLACPKYNDSLAYCSDHRCKEPGCTKYRLISLDNDTEYCQNHEYAHSPVANTREDDAETSFSGLESVVSDRRDGSNPNIRAQPVGMPHRYKDSGISIESLRRHEARR